MISRQELFLNLHKKSEGDPPTETGVRNDQICEPASGWVGRVFRGSGGDVMYEVFAMGICELLRRFVIDLRQN